MRDRVLAALALPLSVALLAWVLLDRNLQNPGPVQPSPGLARLLPGVGFALSPRARHERFPALEEPSAAFLEAPWGVETSGDGLMTAPQGVWQAQASSPSQAPVPTSLPSRY